MSSEQGGLGDPNEQIPPLERAGDHEELAPERTPPPPPPPLLLPDGQREEPGIALDKGDRAVELRNSKQEVQQGQRRLWSKEEDDTLRKLVEVQKLLDWNEVSGKFNQRSPRACAYHYEHKIKKTLKGSGEAFSKEEDTKILKEYDRLGRNWKEIARSVPGRSSEAVRRRFNNLTKMKGKVRIGPFLQPGPSTEISEGDVLGYELNTQTPSQENAEENVQLPVVPTGAKRKGAAWLFQAVCKVGKKLKFWP